MNKSNSFFIMLFLIATLSSTSSHSFWWSKDKRTAEEKEAATKQKSLNAAKQAAKTLEQEVEKLEFKYQKAFNILENKEEKLETLSYHFTLLTLETFGSDYPNRYLEYFHEVEQDRDKLAETRNCSKKIIVKTLQEDKNAELLSNFKKIEDEADNLTTKLLELGTNFCVYSWASHVKRLFFSGGLNYSKKSLFPARI